MTHSAAPASASNNASKRAVSSKLVLRTCEVSCGTLEGHRGPAGQRLVQPALLTVREIKENNGRE